MRRPNTSIILYLLLVFTSGLAVGAFGYRLVSVTPVSAKASAKPDEWRKQYLKEMETRLKLNPDQAKHLNEILDETRARYHDARLSHDKVMKTIKQEQTNKVRSMLTDTQQAEYEKLHAEREQRAKASK